MNSQLLLIARKIDLDVLNFIPSIRNAFGIKIAIFVSAIGSPQAFFLFMVGFCLLFWLHKKPYHLVQFVITVASGSLIVYLMKIWIARPRPAEALVEVSGYSFPSWHAAASTLFCSLIIFAYKNHFKNPILRFVFISFFAISALAISFSRVYLSVHYLSDVVVGIILGLFLSSLSVFIFENFYKKEVLL
ncbi:MAG: phosphatase PAP2 family protein [bacterium]